MHQLKQGDIFGQPAFQIGLFHIHAAHFQSRLLRFLCRNMRIGKVTDILAVFGILNITGKVSAA